MTRRAILALALAACAAANRGGGRPVAPASLDASWLRAAPTPVVVQQRDDDSGIAALAMIAGAWGHHWTASELRRDVGPATRGLELGRLRDVARDRGLLAFAVRGSYDDLARELRAHRPMMLELGDRGGGRNHFEVAVAMDPRDGSIATIDPATGEWLTRRKRELDAGWHAAGYAALVVVGDARAGTTAAPRPDRTATQGAFR